MLCIFGEHGDVIELGDIKIFFERGGRNFFKVAIDAPKSVAITHRKPTEEELAAKKKVKARSKQKKLTTRREDR